MHFRSSDESHEDKCYTLGPARRPTTHFRHSQHTPTQHKLTRPHNAPRTQVSASQTANLRQEVTAILGFANATRDDEVLVRLKSGGGTVTGYGLAAAQLMRVKDANLKLTVVVEEVAASGGYMMACVGSAAV